MPTNTIILRTNFEVQECLRRLEEAADRGQWNPFSLSGYRGSKPLLAKIDGQEIKVWKRIYYRNDFRPYFYGTLISEADGTRIEGYFGLDQWVRIFMWIWMGFVALSCIPMLTLFVREGGLHSKDAALDLVPLYMLAFGVLLPKVGRWIGRGQERFILESLQETLAARVETLEPSSTAMDPSSVSNRPLG